MKIHLLNFSVRGTWSETGKTGINICSVPFFVLRRANWVEKVKKEMSFYFSHRLYTSVCDLLPDF